MMVTADETVVLEAVVEVPVVEVPVVDDAAPVVLVPVVVVPVVVVPVVLAELAELSESDLGSAPALTGAGVAAAAPESVVGGGAPRPMTPRP
jgi:hypothetical protein